MNISEGGIQRVGECHCGALKVIAAGEPERVYLCHCKACQRRTGTAFHFGVTYRRSRVRLAGQYKIYQRGADSGSQIRFYFSPNCGSNLRWESERNPMVCGVAGGALDNFRGVDASLARTDERDRTPHPGTVACYDLSTARALFCVGAFAEPVQARVGNYCSNRIGWIPVRPRSRGGVKLPTGGDGERSPKPASARRAIGGVSRFGAIPKPTVTVRMEENGKVWRTHGVSSFETRTPPLGFSWRRNSHESASEPSPGRRSQRSADRLCAGLLAQGDRRSVPGLVHRRNRQARIRRRRHRLL